jgi:diphosphomevalonate decarboxylase
MVQLLNTSETIMPGQDEQQLRVSAHRKQAENTVRVGWRAPSNIALVKYWGKKSRQLPENGSLSITLDRSATTTFLSFRKKDHSDAAIDMEYYFQGKTHPKFERKASLLLDSLLAEMPFLTDYQLIFQSENNFPHSAGIASSASSMAALALCLVSMEEMVTKKKLHSDDFFRRASVIARYGSGSASRSVYGGIVSWGRMAVIGQSSDEYATPFPLNKESRLNQIRDIILIVSKAEKAVSSSSGHARMTDHPYRTGRKVQANANLHKIAEAIDQNNYQVLAEISENEALSLHALLLSSADGILLLKPETLRIIEEIRRFREESRLDLFFTIDAGPNVHLIYFEDQREMILPFVRHKLSQYCEDGQWIDDRIGNGPQLLTPVI